MGIRLGLIADWLAARQARQEAHRRDRQRAAKQENIRRAKKEIERLSYAALIDNIKECQSGAFEQHEFRDGAFIWLKNFFNPHEGEKETEVRVVSPELRQTFFITFSERAIPKRQEWRRHRRRRRYIAPAPHTCRAGATFPIVSLLPFGSPGWSDERSRAWELKLSTLCSKKMKYAHGY